MKLFYDMFFNTPPTDANSDKLLFLLNGILSEIIFDKVTYQNNIDIKEFTSTVLNKDYKIYLFAGRPTLYAKIIKDLRESQKKDAESFFDTISNIKKYLENQNSKDDVNIQDVKKNSIKKRRKTNTDDVIDGWRKIINKN